MRKISLIHPTRGRKQIAFDTATKWFDRADSSFEYILSVDISENENYNAFYTMGDRDTWVCESDNKTAIEAINNAAKKCKGDILIVISDDFDCPKHWDTLLLKELEGKRDFIVKTRDGLQKTLITLPIMDRVYYNRFGYIYHPEFLHLHSDEELTIVGHMLGKVINSDLLFRHNHYTTGRFEKDAISIKNDSTWGQGQATLERHAKNNFSIIDPLVRREDIVWK
jgi:hypothetical protein